MELLLGFIEKELSIQNCLNPYFLILILEAMSYSFGINNPVMIRMLSLKLRDTHIIGLQMLPEPVRRLVRLVIPPGSFDVLKSGALGAWREVHCLFLLRFISELRPIAHEIQTPPRLALFADLRPARHKSHWISSCTSAPFIKCFSTNIIIYFSLKT